MIDKEIQISTSERSSALSFAPGEADAEEKSWGGFCPRRAGHWPRQGLSLVRDDFLRRGLGGRPLQMVVSHEVLKVKVHRCQRPLYSSRPGSKIQALVYKIYDLNKILCFL